MNKKFTQERMKSSNPRPSPTQAAAEARIKQAFGHRQMNSAPLRNKNQYQPKDEIPQNGWQAIKSSPELTIMM